MFSKIFRQIGHSLRHSGFWTNGQSIYRYFEENQQHVKQIIDLSWHWRHLSGIIVNAIFKSWWWTCAWNREENLKLFLYVFREKVSRILKLIFKKCSIFSRISLDTTKNKSQFVPCRLLPMFLSRTNAWKHFSPLITT